MDKNKPVRAWRLTPIFDPETNQICNAGTTYCLATGEYLLGTSVGEALSPKIVSQLRKTDTARIICDQSLIDAAIEFLEFFNRSGDNFHKILVSGEMLDRAQVANKLKGI